MIRQNKKLIISLVSLLLLLPVFYYIFNTFVDKSNGRLDKVTLAAYRGDSAALIYIAKQKGLFRKNKVDVTIKDYQAGKFAVDDLISDKAEMATATESVLVNNSFQNKDLRILAVISEGSTNRLIARRDHGVNNIGDLAGKKIALTAKTTGEYYLGQFLYLHNLNFSDLEIVDAPPAEIVSQLIAGKVDAAFSRDPNIYEIEKAIPGKTISWDAQVYQPFYFLLLAKSRWINKHPDSAINIVRALIEAEQIIGKDKKQLALFLKTNFNYTDHYLDYILGKHQYYINLSQGLLIKLETQAAWLMENNLAAADRMPNYLDLIYPYALEVADSQRVSLIR